MNDFEELHLPGASTIVVAFASGTMHEFEWAATLKRCGVSYVLIRDRSDRWYTCGIEGMGDFRCSTRHITRITEPYERTVMLGMSTGGFGALLYAPPCMMDEVIAISPITGRGEGVYPDIPQKYWHRVPPVPSLTLDLKPLYNTRPPVWVRAFISDGEGCEVDLEMAARIGCKDIFLIPGHEHKDLGAVMRDSGAIRELLA